MDHEAGSKSSIQWCFMLYHDKVSVLLIRLSYHNGAYLNYKAYYWKSELGQNNIFVPSAVFKYIKHIHISLYL